MQKLIKLQNTHYIIVDDSEIKEGDWYWTPIKRTIEQCIRKLLIIKGGENDKKQFKITHSTEPLEGHDYLWRPIVKPLSLSEVEEAVYGYSIDLTNLCFYDRRNPDFQIKEEYGYDKEEVEATGNFAKKYCCCDHCFYGRAKLTEQLIAHKELTKDKLFTAEDVVEICFKLFNHTPSGSLTKWERRHYKDFIQSIQPTEWDIEFINSKIKLL